MSIALIVRDGIGIAAITKGVIGIAIGKRGEMTIVAGMTGIETTADAMIGEEEATARIAVMGGMTVMADLAATAASGRRRTSRTVTRNPGTQGTCRGMLEVMKFHRWNDGGSSNRSVRYSCH
ncbi:hypothetical protein [Rhizobium sp. NFR07]|uniref:hypothetical protein n=1 Tax=Rhizobium sp. NFR07 TaxID=1566262 RepID=UPI0015A6DA1F|nr:hypothetical protein [Rhizobium sp. NFR07]